MPKTLTYLHKEIRRARRLRRMVRASRLIGWTATSTLAAATLMAWTGASLGAYPAARVGVGLAMVGWVAVFVWREIAAPWRNGEFSVVGGAKWAESRNQALKDKLLSGHELENLTGPTAASHSKALTDAFVGQVEELAQSASGAPLTKFVDVRRPFLGLSASALLLLVTFLWMGDAFRLGLAQWTQPRSGGAFAAEETGESAPASVTDIALTYRYPAYTGLADRRLPVSDGTVLAPAGTQVEIAARVLNDRRGEVEAPLLVFRLDELKEAAASSEEADPSQPAPAPPVSISYDPASGRLTGAFVLGAPGRYAFALNPTEAAGSDRLHAYPMRVEVDEFPQLELRKPKADLEIDEGQPVMLVWRAEDDYGLNRLALVYERVTDTGLGVAEKRKTLAEYDPGQTEDFDRRTIGLDLLGFGSGDRVAIYLEASDNDTINGPKWTQTPRIVVTIKSDEQKRRELAEALSALLETVLKTLAADLTHPLDDAKTYGVFDQAHRTIDAPFKQTLAQFDQIVGQMAEMRDLDLLTVSSLINLAADTRRVREKTLQAIQPVLSQLERRNLLRKESGDPPLPPNRTIESAERQREEIRQLETDVIHLDSLRKKLNMDNLLDEGRSLVDAQEELRDLLDQMAADPSDAALMEKMEELMAQMERKMAELMKKMAELDHELPDDFVNADAFKDSDPQESQDLMEEMREAMKNGNVEEAMKKAEELMAALDEMMMGLEEAAKGYRDKVGNELETAFREVMNDLGDLHKDQGDFSAAAEELKKQAQQEAMKRMGGEKEDFFAKQIERVRRIREELDRQIAEIEDRGEFVRFLDLQNQQRLISESLTYQDRLPESQRVQRSELVAERSAVMRQISALRLENRLYSHFHQQKDWFDEKYRFLAKLLEARDAVSSLTAASETLGRLDRRIDAVQREVLDVPANASTYFDRYPKVSECSKTARDLNREIVEDLEKFQRRLDDMLSPEQKKMMEAMAQRQERIRADAEKTEKKLESLREQVPMIGQGTCDKVGGAGQSMKQAQNEMQQMNPSGGAQHGRAAEERLAEALAEMEAMMEGGGQPQPGDQGSADGGNKPGGTMPFPFGPGPSFRPGETPGGRGGIQHGQVEFSDDYKPPAAFRKELQEAMKEASPEAYEKRIREYYKELIQ